MNLWNPRNVGLAAALLTSYLLGIVHGITPDEHTWPITFSYSVGTYSTRGGAKTGLVFSSGFTAPDRSFIGPGMRSVRSTAARMVAAPHPIVGAAVSARK